MCQVSPVFTEPADDLMAQLSQGFNAIPITTRVLPR